MRYLGLLLTVVIISLLVAYYLQYGGGLTLHRSVTEYKNIEQQLNKVKDDTSQYNGIIKSYEDKIDQAK